MIDLINNRYQKLEKLGEGTYGVVNKAFDIVTKQHLAIKKIRIEDDEDEGIPATTLREISVLKHLSHPSIVQLNDVVMQPEDNKIYLVFNYYPSDFRKYLKNLQIQCMNNIQLPLSFYQEKFYQLLTGVDYCHSKGVLHRDLKPQNLLVDEFGNIKIADFGLARSFQFPLNAEKTKEVVTLWYRSPELLLGDSEYDFGVDMWSVGCILAELITKKPIFMGDGTQISQIFKIFQYTGTPTPEDWPNVQKFSEYKSTFPKFKKNSDLIRNQTFFNAIGELGIDLLERLLNINPLKRLNALEALQHPFLQSFNQQYMEKE